MKTKTIEGKRRTTILLNQITINALKRKAREEHISYSSLIESILVDYTINIKTKTEIEEERKRTQDFLDSCFGVWEGKEYDDIEKIIMEGRKSKPIVEL